MDASRSLSFDPFIPAARQRCILERIERDGRISSVQAAQEFQISEDTIRRDLRELASAGLIVRVHGGAIRKSGLSPKFDTRLDENRPEKTLLAERALALLRPGMSVFVDQGTTNLIFVEQIPATLDIHIITPSPHIAIAAMECGLESVLMIGGGVDPVSRSATGAVALEQIGRIRADICFIGACAVDVEAGLTAMQHEDACLKRAMASASAAVAALVTADKLDTCFVHAVIPLNRLAHMIIPASASKELLARYSTADVEVHLA